MRAFNLYRPPPFFFSASPINITNTDIGFDSTNLTTYDFTGKTLGVDGRVAVAVVGFNQTVSSITLHVPDVATDPTGTSLSLISGATVTNSQSRAEIWITSGLFTAGTSGTVRVTWSGAANDCGISVYEVVGGDGTAHETPVTDTTGDPTVLSVNTPAGGGIISVAGWQATGGATWTGLTEDHDAVGSNIAITTASGNFATEQTGLSVEVDYFSAATQAHLAVSFGP